MALNRISKNMIDRDFVKQIEDTSEQLAQTENKVDVLNKSFLSIDSFPAIIPESDDTGRVKRMRDSAIDNAVLFFPMNKSGYNISEKITFTQNGLWIMGQNLKTTVINFTTSEACFEFVKSDSSGGFHIYDFTVERLQFRGNGVAKKALYLNTTSQINLQFLEFNSFTETAIDMIKGGINTLHKIAVANSKIGIRFNDCNNVNLYSMNMYENEKDFVFEGLSANINYYGLWSEESKVIFYADDAKGNVRVYSLNVYGGYLSANPTLNHLIADFRNNNNANSFVIDSINIDGTHIYMPDSDHLFNVSIVSNPHTTTIVNINLSKNKIRSPRISTVNANSSRVRLITSNNTDTTNMTWITGEAQHGGIDNGGSALTRYSKVNGGLVLDNKTDLSASYEGMLHWRSNSKTIYVSNGSTNEVVITNKRGASSERPSKVVQGQMYFDTTLNKPIWFMGTGWVDANGTVV